MLAISVEIKGPTGSPNGVANCLPSDYVRTPPGCVTRSRRFKASVRKFPIRENFARAKSRQIHYQLAEPADSGDTVGNSNNSTLNC